MSTIHITHEHQFVAVKGNPTEVLELCSQQMKDGKAVPLTESDRLAIAMRMIAWQARH